MVARTSFEDAATSYPQVSIEQVVLKKPEVIFTSRHAIENGTMWKAIGLKSSLQLNKEQLWSLNSDWINRPTTRTLQAIRQVCDYFDKARQNR